MVVRKNQWGASEVRSYRTSSRAARSQVALAPPMRACRRMAACTSVVIGYLREHRCAMLLQGEILSCRSQTDRFREIEPPGFRSQKTPGRGGRDGISVRQRGKDCARWAEGPRGGPACRRRWMQDGRGASAGEAAAWSARSPFRGCGSSKAREARERPLWRRFAKASGSKPRDRFNHA